MGFEFMFKGNNTREQLKYMRELDLRPDIENWWYHTGDHEWIVFGNDEKRQLLCRLIHLLKWTKEQCSRVHFLSDDYYISEECRAANRDLHSFFSNYHGNKLIPLEVSDNLEEFNHILTCIKIGVGQVPDDDFFKDEKIHQKSLMHSMFEEDTMRKIECMDKEIEQLEKQLKELKKNKRDITISFMGGEKHMESFAEEFVIEELEKKLKEELLKYESCDSQRIIDILWQRNNFDK